MNPQELATLLESHDIRPLKARGQHFLLDEGIIGRIVDAAGVGPGDRVVEIGPGPGTLTEALVAKGARVVAVELDPKLASVIEDRFEPAQVTVVRGDARRVPNDELVAAFGDAGPYRVVANLPYAITTDTLVKFLRSEPRPVSVTLMVQREVADRVTAAPPDMSAIAVTVQTLADVAKVTDVPAGAFHPPPRVDSAVIHMEVRLDDSRDPRLVEAMLRLAHLAFTGKRKKIRNTLAGVADNERLEKAFVEANIDASSRPERLDVGDWARLAAALTA